MRIVKTILLTSTVLTAAAAAQETLPKDVHPDSRNRLPPIQGKAGQGAAAIRLHGSGVSARWASPLGRRLTELAILTTAREHDHRRRPPPQAYGGTERKGSRPCRARSRDFPQPLRECRDLRSRPESLRRERSRRLRGFDGPACWRCRLDGCVRSALARRPAAIAAHTVTRP